MQELQRFKQAGRKLYPFTSATNLLGQRAMSRDFRKLRVFVEADQLVVETYRYSAPFPESERYGMQGQLRRAATSVACNIVEGSARPTTREYVRFLQIARGSAREYEYLVDLTSRLGFGDQAIAEELAHRFSGVQAGLMAQIRALKGAAIRISELRRLPASKPRASKPISPPPRSTIA